MSDREERVVAIALILRDAIFSRGQDWYHAAGEIVDALEGEYEWEYNIESTDLVTGKTTLWRETWEPKPDWLKGKIDERNEYDDRLRNAGGSPEYRLRLVTRRKAGRIEDV